MSKPSIKTRLALKLFSFAAKIDAAAIMKASLAGAAAGGFTIYKDGVEFAVYLNGKRITARIAPENNNVANGGGDE